MLHLYRGNWLYVVNWMPPRIKPLSVEWLIDNEGRVMIDGFQIHFRIVEGGAMGFL